MKTKKTFIIAAAVLLCCILVFSYTVVAQQDPTTAAMERVGITFKKSRLFQKHMGGAEEETSRTDHVQSSALSSENSDDSTNSSDFPKDQVVAKVNEADIYKSDVEFRQAMMAFTKEAQVNFEEALQESMKYKIVYQEAERLHLLLSDEQVNMIRRSQMEAFENNPNNDRDAEILNLSKEETVELITQLYSETEVYANVYGYIVPEIMFGNITCKSEEVISLIEQAKSAEESVDRIAAKDEIFDIYLEELLDKSVIEIYNVSVE